MPGARVLRRVCARLPLAALLVLVGFDSRGCTGRTIAAKADAPCVAVDGSLPPGARADDLAGEFRLVLVATSGPRSGESSTGTLRLRRYDAAQPGPPGMQARPGVRYPVYGSAQIGLESVGAQAPGDIDSSDSARPGVLALEWPRDNTPTAPREITLRFGADANRGGRAPIEGTYMALHLRALSADRFAGQWTSGVGTQRSTGHFCAERIAEGR